MALLIPSFPNPKDRTTPLVDAYAFNSRVELDVLRGTGRAVANVYPSAAAAAAGSECTDMVVVGLGEELAPGLRFKTLAEFLQDPEFAAAFATIGGKLYAEMVAKHPALAGATLV